MDTQNHNAAGASAAVFNLADFEARDTAWLEVQNKQGRRPAAGQRPARAHALVRSPGTREALNAQHKHRAGGHQLRDPAGHARQGVEGDGRRQDRARSADKLVGSDRSASRTSRSRHRMMLHSNPLLGYISKPGR
jgi:hypothetical protein